MDFYVNHEVGKLRFTLPKTWRLLTARGHQPVFAVPDPIHETRRALDHPIGSLRIEELARPGMDVFILFDDPQRSTSAHLVLPEVLDRLNRGGTRR